MNKIFNFLKHLFLYFIYIMKRLIILLIYFIILLTIMKSNYKRYIIYFQYHYTLSSFLKFSVSDETKIIFAFLIEK